jgi:hypothetical protein
MSAPKKKSHQERTKEKPFEEKEADIDPMKEIVSQKLEILHEVQKDHGIEDPKPKGEVSFDEIAHRPNLTLEQRGLETIQYDLA